MEIMVPPARLLKFHLALLVLLALCGGRISADPAAQSASPVVSANGEELHGRWSVQGNGVAEFRGIPYAAPPQHALRWKAPRPHSPRKGPQAATEFAPACMQGPGMVDWYANVAAAFGHGREVVGKPNSVSEDCLYLNIWSPDLQADTGLPVMVFVHGGSNSGGWSYEPNYLGARLAQRGVVVVTISYRLGVFGFFSHPALENSENEPVANFGLLDIRQAFGWVSKHIRAFGGNPHNITAFGESAGALNIVDLMLSEAASASIEAPLFRRLVLQSLGGSLDSRQTLAEEQAVGEQVISLLGLDKAITAQGLREIPADRLLAATENLPPDHYHDGVIDGRILKKQPIELLNRVRLSSVDIIAGSNADEWLMYIDENSSTVQLESWVAENAPDHRQALLELVVDQGDSRRALDRLSAGRDMLCPSRYLAAKVSAGGGRGWIYYFSRQRPGPGGERLGAYHGAELPYVFNTHDEWLPTAAADRQLTAAMMDYWVRFARNGDPNAAGRPRWPLHEHSGQAVLTLAEQIALRQSDDRVLCELLGTPRLLNEMENE